MAASKQTSTYTHTLPQCSHASVGLAQVRPNNNIAQVISCIISSVEDGLTHCMVSVRCLLLDLPGSIASHSACILRECTMTEADCWPIG